MFDLFFIKYKMEFHNRKSGEVTIAEWISLVILCVLSVGLIIFSIFYRCFWGFLMCSAGVVIDTIFFLIYEGKKNRKNIDQRIVNYNRNVIDRLVQMLQEEQYCLYNLDGLNWLIDNCEEHIQTEIKQTPWVISMLFPVFSLAYGVALGKMTVEQIVKYTAAVMFIIFCANFLNKYVFSYIKEEIDNPNKSYYQCLKNELEYIKIQYLAKADNSNHLLIL